MPTQEEKTRRLFADLIAPHIIQQSSDIKQTNIALLSIEKHLKQLNGTVAENRKIITTNLPHREDLCPKKNIIEEIRDNMISRKAIWTAVIIGIPLTGTIFAIITHFIK